MWKQKKHSSLSYINYLNGVMLTENKEFPTFTLDTLKHSAKAFLSFLYTHCCDHLEKSHIVLSQCLLICNTSLNHSFIFFIYLLHIKDGQIQGCHYLYLLPKSLPKCCDSSYSSPDDKVMLLLDRLPKI